jgi:hypothetical protein
LENAQYVGRKAQIHDAKLGEKIDAECKFEALGVNCFMKSTPELQE